MDANGRQMYRAACEAVDYVAIANHEERRVAAMTFLSRVLRGDSSKTVEEVDAELEAAEMDRLEKCQN